MQNCINFYFLLHYYGKIKYVVILGYRPKSPQDEFVGNKIGFTQTIMELNTKAYHPFELSEEYNKIILSEDVLLKDNELIHLKIKDNHEDLGFKNIERQAYSIKFLDKYHKNIRNAEQYAEISIVVNRENRKFYIPVNDDNKCKLKWMNKMCWIQQGDNLWKVIALSVVTITAIGIALFNHK